MKKTYYLLAGLALFVASFSLSLKGQSLPENFSVERVSPPIREPNGITFDERGRLYIIEKSGKVRLMEGDSLLPQPLIDISEEVGSWRDHGLLGFALHPNFYQTGHYYLLYAVDRHHLLHYGTPEYHPDSNEYFAATIGRLTRYTADPSTNFTTTLPNSRKVLIGRTHDTGMPILHESHAVGGLAFGTDGTLLVSIGDGASFDGIDVGGDERGAYASQALADGIIAPKEDVGAWRSQLVDSYNGKILRLDPETGEGLPSNPFYDPTAPDAPRSKVWALGLRNPFRFSVAEGTGSHNVADGDPGVIFIGDVGLWHWEEINRADEGGLNFGWPAYEGIDLLWWAYQNHPTRNLDAVNPVSDCESPYFLFQDLLVQARADGNYRFPNPCQPVLGIPEEVPHFVHTPPMLEWANKLMDTLSTRIAFYPPDGGEIRGIEVSDPQARVQGHNFLGSSATGGVFYQAHSFPEAYHNSYFFADYSAKWIKRVEVDSNLNPVAVHPFAGERFQVTDLAVNPVTGDLYFTSYPWDVWRVSYGGNVKPEPVLEGDRFYGPAPLTVQFSAAASSDQNGDPLSFHWDFGDGSSSEAIEPQHTFVADSEAPQSFTVILTVTDTAGASRQRQQVISLNNTPPQVSIVSPDSSFQYSVEVPLSLPLRAEVSDAEHGEEELFYQWQTILHHNSHTHPEEPVREAESSALLTPIGCDEVETYYYRILLEVEDAAGLRSRDEVEIWPDCSPALEWGEVVAAVEETAIRLRWETLFETGVRYFEVERSIDGGRSYEVLGEVSATGESGESVSYTFLDEEPFEGPARYRIKVYEEGIKYEYSAPVAVEFRIYGKVAVYPNPAEEFLMVQINDIEGEAHLLLSDRLGRILLRQSWNEDQTGRHRLNLGNIPPGVYHYRLSNGIKVATGSLVIRN